MTDANGSATGAPDATGSPQSDAQYVYCLVAAEADAVLEVNGVDDATVSVLATDDVGAVTSPAPETIESDSELAVKRLLVAHQRVVDATMDAYGVPLPVQATTAIDGDADAVRTWLASRAQRVREELDALAGHREYHVTVSWDDDAATAAAHDADDDLDDLQAAVDAASPGEAYLREKQYESAVADAVAEQEAALAVDTREQVAGVARSVVDRASADDVSFADGSTDAVVRLAALTAVEDEAALGNALDDVAARDGVTVKFTGPWAPYSFAPDLGDGGGSR
jgi:hypothetical protein